MTEIPRTVAPANGALILTVLGVGFATGLIPAGLLPANVLNIERAYSLSHSDVGRLVGLCMVTGGAAGGLIGGWVCGRLGALNTILAALFLSGSSLMCIGAIPAFAATAGGLAAYFFASGFLGSANTLATHMVGDRQRGVTLMHGSNAIGKLTGPMLASLFLYSAWRGSFLTAAFIPFLLLLPAVLARRSDGMMIGRRQPGTSRPGIDLWVAVAGFGLIAGGEMGVALWLPAFGEKVREFAPAQANLLLSVFLAGLAAGRFAVSALSHRIAPRAVIALCSALLPSAFAVTNFGSYEAVVFSVLLLGLGFSAVWPSYFAFLSHLYPEHLGLLGGASVFSTQVGFAVCAWISGRLADVYLGYPILFGAAVIAAFSVLFFAAPISRRQ